MAFRLEPALLAAASARARREGKSLSELVRQSLRKEMRDAA
jgi:predicted HicB family RNase H-like nuclease